MLKTVFVFLLKSIVLVTTGKFSFVSVFARAVSSPATAWYVMLIFFPIVSLFLISGF